VQKFAIFKKTDKFYWTKNRVIYSSFFLCIGIIWLKRNVLHIKTDILDNLFLGMIGIGFFALIIVMILGFSKPDALRGKLEGFITFREDSIEVDEEVFLISELKNLNITNEDYYGKMIPRGRGNFNSPLSNGVDNSIILTFLSDEKKIYNFELYYSDDFQKIRNELIHYYKLGKMTFDNLCYVLGEKTRKEIEEFKVELSK
jgi:hypothetical protein